MAEYLQIAPHKLIFRFEQGRQSSATITLQNPTDERIAFKVKTTAPQKYSVKPAAGILDAQGDARLAVAMAAPRSPLKAEVKDRFLIEALAVGPEVAAPTSELFKTSAGRTSSTKLKVAWLGPKAGGPSGPSASAVPAAAAEKARLPTPAVPSAPAGSGALHKKQQRQQQEPKTSPAVGAQCSPAAAQGLPAIGALTRLPGAARLAKAAPVAAPQVPPEVLAAFGAAPAAAEAPPAGAAHAAAPAAEVAPAGAGKFSAPLRKRMAQLQEKQQAQQPAQQQVRGAHLQAELAQARDTLDGPPAGKQEDVQAPHGAADQLRPAVATPPAAAAVGVPMMQSGAVAAAGVAAEFLERQEAELAAHAAAAPAAFLNGAQYIGQAVKKSFKGRCYAGKVMEYVPEEEWWLVKYEDSDEEHIDFEELQRILVARPSRRQAGRDMPALQAAPDGPAPQAGPGPAQDATEAPHAQPEEQAAASPANSALASHHTELAPAQAEVAGTAGSGAPGACTSAQPAAAAHMQAAVSSATRRLPTRGARLDVALKAQQQQQQQQQHQQQQIQQPEGHKPPPPPPLRQQSEVQGAKQRPAPVPARQAPVGAAPAGVPAEDALRATPAGVPAMEVAERHGLTADSLGSKKLALAVERQERHEQLDLGSEEEAGGQRSGPSASALLEDEEAQLPAGQADSDPDFVLEEELLLEEVEEQRWMAEQRRLRRLSASPAIGGVAKRGRRRRSGAAVAAVAVKEEQHRQRHRPAKHRQQEEVVDLLTDSDSDSGLEEHGPSARRATARPAAAACQPRTKASHPVSAHRTLRFTLAGPNGNALAEVAVRGCTPLRAIAAALAARCLDGGSGTEASQLQLCVEGSRAPLDQALTVKAAGLHDGGRILVGLPEVSC